MVPFRNHDLNFIPRALLICLLQPKKFEPLKVTLVRDIPEWFDGARKNGSLRWLPPLMTEQELVYAIGTKLRTQLHELRYDNDFGCKLCIQPSEN